MYLPLDLLLVYWIEHATIAGTSPNSKVHGANMGPIWGRQDPGGPHVGPMNFAIWVYAKSVLSNGMFYMWVLGFATDSEM